MMRMVLLGLLMTTPLLARSEPVIRTLGELDCWLAHIDQHNPLGALSSEARMTLARDAQEVEATDGKRLQFSVSRLMWELPPAQVRPALALFGLEFILPADGSPPPAARSSCEGASPLPDGPLAQARQAAAWADPATPAGCARDQLIDPHVDAAAQHACWARMAAARVLPELRTATLMDASSMLAGRAYNTGDAGDADALRIVVEELNRRPHSGDSDDSTLYGTLLAVGRPEQAEALQRMGRVPQAGPVLRREPLQEAPPTHLARYWRTHLGQYRVSEAAVDLTRGAHVLVYTAPGCSFCVRAAREISANGQLRAVFQQHGRWVHIPSSNHALAYYDSWNSDHADMPVDLIFDRRNWSMPEDMLTPSFVLLKDGVVVSRLRGWPRGQLDALREGLRAIGLL